MTALAGRVALVTGASRGIGAATARALARDGAHVVLVARTSAGLEEVEEAIHRDGGSATIAPLDLSDAEAVPRLAAAMAPRWPALDILVMAAGVLGTLTPVQHVDAKEFAAVIATNFVAPQRLIAAFDTMLRASAAGRIVALTSSVGSTPRAYWGAYGASKAAMETLLLAYAAEVANIAPLRIAIVDPGATRTKMRARAFPGEDPDKVKPPEVVADAIADLLARDFETGHRLRVPDPVSA